MAPLTPHWECISDHLRAILQVVGRESFSQQFYLAGGTALALQLGHRVSVDLDFFAPDNDLLDDFRRDILTHLKPHLDFEIVHDVIGSLLLNIGGVALGFFSYHYPLIEPPLQVEQVALAGLVDIGLMKLDAVASRSARKDFYDLYFIAQTVPLETLLARSRDKYPDYRDFGLIVLEGLADFSVADQHTPIQTTPPVEWAEVRAFCRQEVQRLGKQWFEV
jgi:hypothetical protein